MTREMTKREEAIAVLEAMYDCVPRDYFSRMDEISRGGGFVLGYLERAEGVVYAGDIARRMGVSTARIAAILNRMEKNGLIQRAAAPTDARKTVVTLTKSGRVWTKKVREQMLDRTELLLERVGAEDIREFIRISKKIRDAMEN